MHTPEIIFEDSLRYHVEATDSPDAPDGHPDEWSFDSAFADEATALTRAQELLRVWRKVRVVDTTPGSTASNSKCRCRVRPEPVDNVSPFRISRSHNTKEVA